MQASLSFRAGAAALAWESVFILEKTDCHNQSADWFRNDKGILQYARFVY